MIQGFTLLRTKNSYVADLFIGLGVIPPSLQARTVRRRPLHNGTLLWRLIFALLILTTSFLLGECGNFQTRHRR